MSADDQSLRGFDIETTMQTLKDGGDKFAVATVVRTVSVTAAKPGAKAIINAEGEIVDGWIGGGCARTAVVKAAIKSIAEGEPKLVSLQPEELLQEKGLTAGQESDGVLAANNMCPSRGSMEIFIEPVLCEPELLILGASPVARELASMVQRFSFKLSCACEDPVQWSGTGITAMSYNDLSDSHSNRYVVVSTQGSGDIAALQKALSLNAKFVSFVGSPRKMLHLKDKLKALDTPAQQIDLIKGPAGLDIGGVTPQEIALSILAELVALRRGATALATKSTFVPQSTQTN